MRQGRMRRAFQHLGYLLHERLNDVSALLETRASTPVRVR
jgi:hypothetical protein